ncbi:MAG: amino acid adenylation domain-containing protein, partial [Chloroflexi bacterium]|nr:amino acid adenylation domain-containing protein [Chloroflexota bacterium]
GAIVAQQLAYWQRELADAPTVLALPTDHPRPPRPSLAGAVAPLELSPALTTALRQYSQGAHATTFMTLLAAFAVVLARHSGQAEVVIGVPVAGRTRPETAGLIGFFVNMLPLRVRVGQARSFGELVAAVRTAALAAYAQQDLPFELLVEALTPERSLHHAPIVQVACTLRQATELDLPGVTVRQEPVPQTTSKLDLTLGLVETATGLAGGLEYSTELFAPATIARLAGHVVQVLDQALAAPDAPLHALPLLTAPEYQQLVHEWNRSEAEYPRAAAVHQLIEAQAERTPDRMAIVYEGASLTYAELNARANQLAHHLRAEGVGPDVLVALMVERSLEMIVGMLAILKAGGAYVPLDPAYPADRLQYMLSHSRARVILTQDRLVSRLPEHQAQVFRLDADWHVLAAQPTTNPPRTALPDNLAYIIFTSGSTGRPKGVMVRQQGLINLVHGLRAYFDDPVVHHVGLITSISFDISVNQIFPTLFFGRTLHIIPDPIKYNSRALLGYLHEQQIHLLDAVPSYMQAVLNEVAPEQPANALRYLLIGGEKIEQRLLQSVFGQIGHTVEIVNIYGLTEISDINALGVIRAEDIGKPITVGKPLQNNRIYILDQFNQLNPIGVAGEVCIAGDSLSRGYLFRPELTAERFVVCPFEDGQLMVRTGDLGRWQADGTIEILGRIDHQVKIQGFRIETGEIEAVLATHPQVSECVVVAREDAVGADALAEKRLVGYITLRTEASAPTPSELRQLLGAHLPHYMIPSAFVVLERLPQTPNGKVDRKALPVPQWDLTPADASEHVPQTPVEELLAALWVELLPGAPVTRQANFFALGGHSLLATRMLAQVRTLVAVDLPLAVVFECPTLADLAAAITAQQRAAAPTLPPIQPIAQDVPLPLSFAQQRLWFVEQLVPGTAAYNIPLALRLHGALDVAALRHTLQQLVDRHAALRTTFQERDGQAWQVIAPTLGLDLVEQDLRAATDDPNATAQALAAA